jgi:hypothetical protein
MPRPTSTLTSHEKCLLILYRTAPVETRAQLDSLLFEAWTHTKVSTDPRANNTLWKNAVRQLHAEHLVSSALTGFAAFWTLRLAGGAK